MMRIFIVLILVVGFISCNDTKKEVKKEDAMNEVSLKGFKNISPKQIDDNFIKLIGDQWMLVTAGDSLKFNTMTASWGCAGYLWNRPVVFIFVRPQRYTFGFLEDKDEFTLSFFREQYREALRICGTLSGRDVNKMEKTGLTPLITADGNVTFNEARLVLECKKIYADFLNPEAFIDKAILKKDYPGEDYHKIYVAEIVNAWEK